MTLCEKLRQKLSDGPPGPGRADVLISDESGWTVTLTLDKHEELSCLIWEVKAQSALPAANLRGWADAIATRVSGLFEPLKVLEIDEGRKQAILRSEKTSRRKDVQVYFEVFLESPTSVVVRRYQVPASLKREQTSFALTHEAMIKLVTDLISR